MADGLLGGRTWRHTAAAARTLSSLLSWRIDVSGVENIPRSGPAVLVFNHHSMLDSMTVAWAPAVMLGRPVRFLAKREAVEAPLLGRLLVGLGAIPVDRGSSHGRVGALNEALSALSCGHIVALAPEQTRSSSLELLPFRQGAARMAIASGAPVIPCVSWGSQRILSRSRVGVKLRDVDILVEHLPPIVLGDDDPAEATERIRAVMSGALLALQDRYPGGHPAGAPWVPRRLGGSAPTREEGEAEYLRRTSGWSSGGRATGQASPS